MHIISETRFKNWLGKALTKIDWDSYRNSTWLQSLNSGLIYTSYLLQDTMSPPPQYRTRLFLHTVYSTSIAVFIHWSLATNQAFTFFSVSLHIFS